MYKFKFADIGEGIHEGKLLKWMFDVGDEVKDGDTLFLVETDKVNAEIPSPVDGVIKKLLAEEGDTIHVGDVVVEIDDGEESESLEEKSEKKGETRKETIDEGKDMAGVVGELEVGEDVLESSDENEGKEEITSKKKSLATPVARKLAKDLGIDINSISGSGANGRVMKEDIYKASEMKEKSDQKDDSKGNNKKSYIKDIDIPKIKIDGEVERVKVSKMRKTIAENMVLSKSVIPHASSMDDFDVSELVEFRKEQKEIADKQGIKLTYMPFIIKAITLALKEYPILNSSYDMENEEIILKKYYNIGIAVDTPEGLMVPVVKNADRKGILEISKEMNDLIEKSQNRTIGLENLRGGTFSITNYGAVGSTYGVPVIKYPEAAILGIGRITKKPVVKDGEIVIRDIVPISLSIDHRIIDGADAGRFLNKVKEYLQDPMLLLLS
ncbi:dihydrolipoamide acetyltransferase family protein [Senegalia massiliensis]|uniref:Dihydrolipoamide acetyltransferase component of pyruvate dehydrogenase complex n=1 Tax=Senegalia massiliensis TaxID=1720316 RepID=A0A845QW37_9CLOT|nr:dihydrolipoamide acetyltransferase family protein [Senegalia massiliensis]NBI05382.1 2-oxo acid dehydrogenase subunit E2 [Senegalia massiliensis]